MVAGLCVCGARWGTVTISFGGAGVDGALSMATIAIEVVIGAWEVGGVL